MAVHQNHGKGLLGSGWCCRKAGEFGWDMLQFGLMTHVTDAGTHSVATRCCSHRAQL